MSFAFLGWAFGSRLSAVSRQLDQTKLELAAANSEVARLQGAFAEVSVLHTLWGMGSQFGAAGAGVCRGDEDKANVRAATLAAIEMWSDSEVRAEMNLERSVLPVLQGLRQQGIQVVGASLSPGVIAQYRRFRREGVGDVVMLDRSRIIDAESREAALALLRRAGEGQLDPAQTHVVYRFDQYGAVTYPLIQGPSDAAMLTARLSDEPLAEPVTVAATDFPCS